MNKSILKHNQIFLFILIGVGLVNTKCTPHYEGAQKAEITILHCDNKINDTVEYKLFYSYYSRGGDYYTPQNDTLILAGKVAPKTKQYIYTFNKDAVYGGRHPYFIIIKKDTCFYNSGPSIFRDWGKFNWIIQINTPCRENVSDCVNIFDETWTISEN